MGCVVKEDTENIEAELELKTTDPPSDGMPPEDRNASCPVHLSAALIRSNLHQ